MKIEIAKAREQFDEILRSARAGEHVVLTENGAPVAQLQGIKRDWKNATVEERRAALKAIWENGRRKRLYEGEDVRDIQNQLHDDLGIP